MSTNELNKNLKLYFPNPPKNDVDKICIYTSKLDNGNIRELTRIAYKTLQKLYGTNQKKIRCCITDKEMTVYNNYPIIDGIFMISSKKYSNFNHISISRRCKIYPISMEALLLINTLSIIQNNIKTTKSKKSKSKNILTNKCKYGRVYREGIILRFLKSHIYSIGPVFDLTKEKYNAILTSQRFYKNIVRPRIEKKNQQFNESFCVLESVEKDNKEQEDPCRVKEKQEITQEEKEEPKSACTIC